MSRTAQRMDAASALSMFSGMGVTWRTQDRTYCEKVPSTEKPLHFALEHAESAYGQQMSRDVAARSVRRI